MDERSTHSRNASSGADPSREAADAQSPTGSPARRRKIGRRAGIIWGSIAAIVIAIVIAFQVSPWPSVLLYRGLMSLADPSGPIGPYGKEIESVSHVGTEQIVVDGLPDATLTLYAPTAQRDDSVPLPVILYIHGGGWIGGTAESVSNYSRLLSSGGYLVANLEYSLAPEHPYPAPVRQSAAALEFLHENASNYGGDGSRLFLAGNSAGAQISSQIGALVADTEMQAESGIAVTVPRTDLRGLVLLNGVFDFDTAGRAGFPGFTSYLWAYTGVKQYQEYARIDELSTARNITPDFPDTFLTAGDGDVLETQTYELDAILRGAGVDVTALYWTGSGRDLPHDYMLSLDTEAAQAAYEAVSTFLSERSD